MKAKSRTARQMAMSMLVVALAACSAQEPDPEAGKAKASASDGAALLVEYQAARGMGNWTGAAAIGQRLVDEFPDSAAATETKGTLPDVQARADALVEAKRVESLWTYQAMEAGKGVQRSASIDSHTTPAEEGEFAQPADAKLILRDHPAWGRSAYLILNETVFRCGSPCRMDIAFDDAKATRWAGKQADSGKGPALFINDEARFLKSLESAKTIRVTLPKDSGHIKALRFDTAGFRRPSYDNAKPIPLP